MLLQGAYSDKYRAVRQEKIDNLRDEERQEFNVKLEKTKELSRDTNRRRRALEERRKNYEAEEERKRREILAQRKKEIQEATEKFQRSNVVRHRKKIKNIERTTPTKTVKHDNTRPVSAKSPKVINGRPYYPSVEEVMALLHADRAEAIDRLSNGDNQARDQHEVPGDDTERTDITAEQRIMEQERLRSEVVGRVEPKLAFSDERKDITAGVLPTTIRRNSPSGSLSSVDSLDAVLDEELEPMPDSDGSPLAGIIRKSKKGKRDSRVTFNENVAFSDGVVGTLKRKQGTESAVDASVMPKQKSFFELSKQPGINSTLSEDSRNGFKLRLTGKGLESSKDSLIFNHYLSRQPSSKSSTPMSSAQVYPHVNASDMATTGVMTYSGANNTREPSGNSVTAVIVTTAEPNSPKVNGHGGYAKQTKESETNRAVKNNDCEEDHTRNKEELIYENSKEGVKSKPYVNGSGYENTGSYNNDELNKKINEGPACSQSFSSINASMLKDSLEMHSDIRISQSDRSIPQVSAQDPDQLAITSRSPNPETQRDSSSSRRITTHADIPPETPLVPITKRDFLSKALRSERNGNSSTVGLNTNAFSDHARTQVREDVADDGATESPAYRFFNGSHMPSTEQSIQFSAYRNSFHGPERDVSQNSRSLSQQNEGKMLTQSAIDRSRHCHDPYNQRQTVLNNGEMRDNTRAHDNTKVHNDKHDNYRTKQNVYDNPYSERYYNRGDIHELRNNAGYLAHNNSTADTTKYSGITHPNDHGNSFPKQGYQLISRDNQGKQRPNRTTRESLSAISSRSRADPIIGNNERLTTTQNRPGTTNTPNQAPYRSSLSNNQQNSASKPSPADELLKSVQENIERISMTPVQQGISKTNSSGMNPASHVALYQPRIAEDRHKRANSDHGRRPAGSEHAPVSEITGNIKSAANGRQQKLTNRKVINDQRSKPGEANKVNGNSKRFHKPGTEYDSGIGSQRRMINMEYSATQNGNHDIATANPNTEKYPYASTNRLYSAHPSQVDSNHKTDYQSPTYPSSNRLYGAPPENRGVHSHSSWTTTSERKKNSSGLAFLDKTPTDEEINTLWETVRTCLKHEQPQRAASDSVVNNVRYSRSESGPLVGNHYLIDGNAWTAKPNGVSSASDNDPRYWRGTHFRRQGSLDSLQRRGSAESVGYIPPRKGSLLQHRSHTSDRRLVPRNSQAGRPPVNPQYLHSFRGPMTSTRGPQKSNTVNTEEPRRPQLSYAEFQAVMQASADVKIRNTEGENQKNSRLGVHQPIIKNYRREPSALSLEEKRLLESLDRLNERLKIQEAFSGKIAKSPRNGNIHTNKVSSSKSSHSSAGSSRFGSTRSANGRVPSNNSSLLNRR